MITGIRPRPVDDPALRLIVFHHAGGSASGYFPLIHGIPPDWDLILLDLPGRGKRHTSPPLEEMATLVATMCEDVLAWRGPPLALFGHSLGAVVAAEVARSLQERGIRPVWVGVSGRSAPTVAATTVLRGDASDEELVHLLNTMGVLPERLNELPEYRERLLRLVRSDLRAVESYRPDPGRRPLLAPLTALGATEDALAPPATLDGWVRETSAGFARRLFNGGHFHFLGPMFVTFADALVQEIRRAKLSTIHANRGT